MNHWVEPDASKPKLCRQRNQGDFAMLRKFVIPALLAGSMMALAGCGYSPGHRALTGGAIGAGGGAIVGAATGLGPANGALIGAGAGALTGAATSHNQVNLGN
jgi:hypothetical protein